MPIKIWSHLCDYATVDHASRKATIVGEFENINTKQVPTSLPFMAVATKWAVQDGEKFNAQVRIKSPSGQTITESPVQPIAVTLQDPDREGTHTAISYFLGTQFPEFGTYLVETLIDGEVDHAIQLNLKEVQN